MSKTKPRLNRVIRKARLPDYTGLQRTAIEELIRRGEFKLFTLTEGGRAQGILEDDLIAWQQRRRAAADATE